MNVIADLFPGFAERRIETAGAEIFLRTGGTGPPLLLLHGYPQAHVCWHKIAPELARHCTLVIPDTARLRRKLRPAGDAEHMAYSKRAMAQDCLAVMRALGHERFMVAGHDRGGRVGYRLALDHPEAVSALIPVDIVPTAEAWRRTTADRAVKRLPLGVPGAALSVARDADRQGPGLLPRAHAEELGEAGATLATSRPRRWRTIARCCRSRRAFTPSARTTAPAPTIDRRLDEADMAAGRKIACPTFVLWGSDYLGRGRVKPLDVWRAWCTQRAVGLPRSTRAISWPRRTPRPRWRPCCRFSQPRGPMMR